MDKIFVNMIILLILGYFSYSRATFHCRKLFHPTLFTTIYDFLSYFWLFLVISS
jgi:hypothetical protein